MECLNTNLIYILRKFHPILFTTLVRKKTSIFLLYLKKVCFASFFSTDILINYSYSSWIWRYLMFFTEIDARHAEIFLIRSSRRSRVDPSDRSTAPWKTPKWNIKVDLILEFIVLYIWPKLSVQISILKSQKSQYLGIPNDVRIRKISECHGGITAKPGSKVALAAQY